MSRIGFAGYYGMGNYGDDLFVVTSLLAAGKYWNGHTTKVLGSAGPYGSRSRLSLRRRTGAVGALVRAGLMARASLSVDRLVFSGGSLFHANSSRVHDLLRRSVQLRGNPVAAIGVSIGPFACVTEARRVKSRLRGFDYLAVRDRSSFELAHELGLEGKISYAADLAFLYPKLVSRQDWTQIPSNVVGFSPCSLRGERARSLRYCKRFVESMVHLHRVAGFSSCVLNLNEHPSLGDDWLCTWTETRLREEGVPVRSVSYGSLGVHGTWRLISSFDGYVSVRLHGAITAAAIGVPYVLQEYHSKCTDFLDDVGYLREARAGEDGPIDLEALVKSRIGMPQAEFLDRARRNFTEAPWLR